MNTQGIEEAMEAMELRGGVPDHPKGVTIECTFIDEPTDMNPFFSERSSDWYYQRARAWKSRKFPEERDA